MSKQINVDHLAKLAQLVITKEEKIKLEKQLVETVDYIDILEELSTKKVEPTFQVTGQSNVSRKDKAEDFLNQDEALDNAPGKNNGYFVVKKIKWGN